MKIGGIEIIGDLAKPNEDILVLPRPNDNQIVLTARAILEYETLANLCPAPKPRQIFTKSKGWHPDEKHKDYLEALNIYANRKLAYIVLKSLEPSNIEWSTVDMAVPGTWTNWEDELMENGFSVKECNLITGLALTVNQLDESKLEEARELFLQGQEREVNESDSPNSEANTTPSGEPANPSE